MNSRIDRIKDILAGKDCSVCERDEIFQSLNFIQDQIAYLETIFHESPDAIFVKDKAGNILMANDAAGRIHGLKGIELVGMTIFDLTGPTYQQQMREQEEKIQTGEILQFDTVMKVSRGLDIPIEVKLQSIDYKGIPAVLMIVREIGDRLEKQDLLRKMNVQLEDKIFQRTQDLEKLNTELIRENQEKKIFQNELESQKNFLQKLIDVNPSMMVVKDKEGDILLANEAFAEFYANSSQDLVGKNIWELYGIDEKLEEYKNQDLQVLESGGVLSASDQYIRNRSTGEMRILQVVKKPIYRKDDENPYILVVATDVTEIKNVEEALRKSNQELESFAYVASHDLQSPLRTIVSYLQLIQQRSAGQLNEESSEFLDFSIRGARKMQQVILDLLDYSRIQARLKPIEFVDINYLIRTTVLGNLDAQIRSSEAQISIDEMPVIYCYKGQMMLLFQNLIGNAMKFVKAKVPKVNITFSESPDEWIFSVSDNGIGISEEFSQNIFQIFQRLHSEEDFPGTGVGLAICKKVVELHQGRIWFESGEDGTTFSFTVSKNLRPENA